MICNLSMSFVHGLSRSGLSAGLRVAVASAARRATGACLGIGLVLGLSGCPLFSNPTTDDMYPTMTPEAAAVRIYYSGEDPECAEILSLGKVQARAGGYPDPLRPKAPVNMDVALAWLRVEAWKRGGNGVRLLEHKGNSDATIHMAIGEAIFCRTVPN